MYMTDFFFICFIESTWDADLNTEKIKIRNPFLHCALAVRKCEISLPVRSKTMRGKDLGLDEP